MTDDHQLLHSKVMSIHVSPATMPKPPTDIIQISLRFNELADEVVDGWEIENSHQEAKNSPYLIRLALQQLTDILRTMEDPEAPFVEEIDLQGGGLQTLGNYGLQLLAEMADWAERLELSKQADELRVLGLPFALWVVRRGGEIHALEPVVNGIAVLANRVSGPDELNRLFHEINQLIGGIPPSISQDTDRSNPGRPWRILLINRAIIATRSLSRPLMEQAYDGIVELLPEDTTAFFSQAMEQMDIVGYPDHVRELVQTYFMHCQTHHTLH